MVAEQQITFIEGKNLPSLHNALLWGEWHFPPSRLISTGRHLYLVVNGDVGPSSHYKNGALPSREAEALASQHRKRSDDGGRMLPWLKAALALLSLLELIASRPMMTTSPKLKLSEITHRIQQLNSGVQVNAARASGFSLPLLMMVMFLGAQGQAPQGPVPTWACRSRSRPPQSATSHLQLWAPWPASA